jgi:peptidyl-prolyl cis-trans isomerase B (cyclophilin B)
MRSVFRGDKILTARSHIIVILIFFLCFNQFIIAQYSPAFTDLLHTTYTREFDNSVLLQYLSSNEQSKINAALLSISNSRDTSFADEVINLEVTDDELKNFCLESLGQCFQTTKYFREKVFADPDSAGNYFTGISYTGNQSDLDKTIEYYSTNKFSHIPISLILLNFSLRGFKTSEQNKLMANELSQKGLKTAELKSLLYVLSRLKSEDQLMTQLSMLLDGKINGRVDTEIIQYILLAFRRNNYFPEDRSIFNYLISTENVLLRSLAASVICFKKEFTESELRQYFQLLYDNNEIAARQTAISLRNLSVSDSLSLTLENSFLKILFDENVNENARGELLVSYTLLFPDKFISKKIPIPESIPDKFRIRSYANLSNNLKYFDELVRLYNSEDKLTKIESLTSLISFSKNDTFRAGLKEIYFDALVSETPALISIAADALDSVFIIHNQNKLENILSAQIEKHISDPNFTESILSIMNLSERMNNVFYKKILGMAKYSSTYSIKKLAYQKLKLKDEITKVDSNFMELLQYAFKYQAARIITNKGAFEIKFLPEVAPISVGNFVKLAEENFYDGIIFHRVVPGFVIQAGDKSATGWEGPGYEIISEFSNVPFNTGAVGMASSGVDTEGSQFFVMLGSYPHLNGKYTNFGQLIDGYENLYKIDEGDFIIKIILVDELD